MAVSVPSPAIPGFAVPGAMEPGLPGVLPLPPQQLILFALGTATFQWATGTPVFQWDTGTPYLS